MVLPAGGCGAGSGESVVGLVSKTDTNPFFVKMRGRSQKIYDRDSRHARRRRITFLWSRTKAK
jgi:hypothetical protein